MNVVRIAAALAALAASAVCALLAADIRAWRDAFRATDARFEVGATREQWVAHERVPAGVAADILDVEDDRRMRHALQRFRIASQLSFDPLGGQEREGAHGAAERAAVRVAASGDRRAASRASVLLGVLAFDQPQGSDRAVALFENALKLDPSNDDAKHNLELVLRVLRPGGARPGETGAGPSTGRPRGAGAGETGGGY